MNPDDYPTTCASVEKVPVVPNSVIESDVLSWLMTVPDSTFDCIVADPPYNLQLGTEDLFRPDGSLVTGVKDSWDRYDSLTAYQSFVLEWLCECQRVMKPTATIWVFGSYHNIFTVGSVMQGLDYWILNDIVWLKVNPLPNMRGTRFCNAHEHIIWAKRDQKAKGYTFNYQRMKEINGGKQMRSDWWEGDEDVWQSPICQGRERLKTDGGATFHRTQKPLNIARRIVEASTRPDDLVLDLFAGTATVSAAAQELGRHWVAVEREPRYVDAIRRRLSHDPDQRNA